MPCLKATANVSCCRLRIEGKIQASWAGVIRDVIAPPLGELFSETNDNSVAIFLTYGTAHLLLASDAEFRVEEYVANDPYTRP